MTEKITRQTKISELFYKNPEAARMLFEAGLHCIGCPMAARESIEQGCKAHGFEDKKIDELIKKMNEVLEKEDEDEQDNETY